MTQPLAVKPPMSAYRPRGVCQIPGCGRPHEAKGRCKRHYKRWRTATQPKAPKARRERPPCRVAGCNELNHGHGLCHRHYVDFVRHTEGLSADQYAQAAGGEA